MSRLSPARGSSPQPESVPACPNGIFDFAEGSVLVTDPDEEIFELYMDLASNSPETTARSTSASSESDHSGGLGFLDSNSSVLELVLDLAPLLPSGAVAGQRDTAPHVRKGGRNGKKVVQVTGPSGVDSVSVRLMQDLGALKGRKGDTGSVLWRSSLHLARYLLSQHYHPQSSATASNSSLLDPALLRQCRVLELGAGTGLLAILLSRLCASYTASDRLENLKLAQRNLELNGVIGAGQNRNLNDQSLVDQGQHADGPQRPSKGKRKGDSVTAGSRGHTQVCIEEVDWVAVSEERRRHPSDRIWASSSSTSPVDGHSRANRDSPGAGAQPGERYDLILAVDCIYNEHLVQPLVDTITRYCPCGGKTVVWVVVELRSADVLTLFLERWMNDPAGPWTIVRLGKDAMGPWEGRRARWVGWVGWR